MKTVKKALGLVFWGLLVFWLIYGVYSTVDYFANSEITSFPWYAGFALSGIYLLPLAALTGIAYLILRWIQKRKER